MPLPDYSTEARAHFLAGWERGVKPMAERYGMATIAEGVDDEDMMGVLRAGGVDYAQGFHRQRRA